MKKTYMTPNTNQVKIETQSLMIKVSGDTTRDGGAALGQENSYYEQENSWDEEE